MGAMAVDLIPEMLIEGTLHPLDESHSETVVLHFSIEDVKVLKRTIDRLLATVDTEGN